MTPITKPGTAMDTSDSDFQKTLLVRTAGKEDASFIIHSWLTSFREGDWVEGVPNQVYYHSHHKVVESILSRATVLVLCLPDAPEVMFGWICVEGCENGVILHYLYVKHEFRGNRMASRLLKEVLDAEAPAVVFCTHRVKPMGFEFKKRGYIYNPYLLSKDMPR